MNKGLQTFAGIVLFVLLVIPALGIIVGFSEANAFNTAKVETIQRIRETGHNSPSVTDYIASVNERFDDTYKVNITLDEDNDGDGKISYGDVIKVGITAEGSGSFKFKKSKSQVEKEGRAEGDNLPQYKTSERLLIDRRVE